MLQEAIITKKEALLSHAGCRPCGHSPRYQPVYRHSLCGNAVSDAQKITFKTASQIIGTQFVSFIG